MSAVIRSAALDLLRRESRRAAREKHAAPAAAAAASAPGEIEEKTAWVLERLRELPADDAALVALRLGREASLDQSGAAESISGDAAHGRIRRALTRLRTMAKETFGD
jgi:DNA-directed RNA polymerase specialized sigma24 family protein